MKLVIFMFFCTVLMGQRGLYNGDLDKRGQDAAAKAKALASDPVTAAEIANLAIIEKHQLETALNAAKNSMRLRIQSFDTWSNVYVALGDVSSEIALLRSVSSSETALTERQKEVKTSTERLKEAIQAKEKKGKDEKDAKDQKTGAKDKKHVDLGGVSQQFLDETVDHISDVNDLISFAKQIRGLGNIGGDKAIKDVEDGIKELDELIKVVTAAIKAAKDVSVDPRSLMPSQDQLLLTVLSAETDSLKERIAIRARADLEVGDVLELNADAKHLLETTEDCVAPCSPVKLSTSTRRIADTLAAADLQRREKLLMVLYEAAAVAGQGQTPEAIALIRDSIAWRRFEIRRDAVYNHGYEQAIQVAGQRLSAYYAAGIKPSQIAQLLYYLSGIVSLPVLAF